MTTRAPTGTGRTVAGLLHVSTIARMIAPEPLHAGGRCRVPADTAVWPSHWSLLHHFYKHGPGLGRATVEAYDESARATIRVGRRFTYTDPSSSEARVGYYHPPTQRFTALSADESRILTHFRRDEAYVRRLPDSTYER
jgi:hypothetical protein